MKTAVIVRAVPILWLKILVVAVMVYMTMTRTSKATRALAFPRSLKDVDLSVKGTRLPPTHPTQQRTTTCRRGESSHWEVRHLDRAEETNPAVRARYSNFHCYSRIPISGVGVSIIRRLVHFYSSQSRTVGCKDQPSKLTRYLA